MIRDATYSMLELLSKKTKSSIFVVMLCVFLAVSPVMLLRTARGEGLSTTTIFTDPLLVETIELDQNFTVNINISKAVNLYAWQAGITFNPEVLECIGFYEGEFLRRSNQTTIFVKHVMDMNNTLGIVYFRGCCILGPLPGIDGSGQLAYVTFRSVGIGVSDFHLTDIILLNTELEDIPFEVQESFTVPLKGANYAVGIANNITGENDAENPPVSGVFDTTFSINDKKISFEALSVKDWFCQLSVPKSLLKCGALSQWTIEVDGTPISYTAAENTTHTSLSFSHINGIHTVAIIGTEVAGNLPSLTPPMLLVATTALLGLVALTIAMLDLKKTRKLLGYKVMNPPTNSSL